MAFCGEFLFIRVQQKHLPHQQHQTLPHQEVPQCALLSVLTPRNVLPLVLQALPLLPKQLADLLSARRARPRQRLSLPHARLGRLEQHLPPHRVGEQPASLRPQGRVAPSRRIPRFLACRWRRWRTTPIPSIRIGPSAIRKAISDGVLSTTSWPNRSFRHRRCRVSSRARPMPQ